MSGSNEYVPGYPGALGIQQLLGQLFTGQGGGLGQLAGLAGIGSTPSGTPGIGAGAQPSILSAVNQAALNRSGVGYAGQAQRFAGQQANVGGATQPRGSTGISQFLNMQSPTMQALNTALPALQDQLSGGGADVLNPLRTSYQQNLGDLLGKSNAGATNRFSSGLDTQNTLLKQRSLADFNTLGGQLLEQGKSRQLQAATTLGGLAGSAQDSQMKALMALFGPLLGNTFGGTNVHTPDPFTQILQAGAGVAGSVASGPGVAKGGKYA